MGGLLSPTLQPSYPAAADDPNMSIDHDVKFVRGPSASQPGSSAALAGASPSSDDDSPDHDLDQDMDLPDEPGRDGQPDPSAPLQPPLPPKRKGGRKPVGWPDSCLRRLSSRAPDIRHVRGAQAAEPAGAGRLPRAQDRVHQAARGHDKAPRG
jgi:hypothetical protein